jgi:hypothetical protein
MRVAYRRTSGPALIVMRHSMTINIRAGQWRGMTWEDMVSRANEIASAMD